MKLSARLIIVSLGLLAAVFVVLAVAATAGNPQILFTDNTAAGSTSTEVTEMEQALLDRINAAATSINAAIYGFDRASIHNALIAAHNRGVSVPVVTDDDAYNDADYNPFYTALETAGIPIVLDNRSSIMHNKFFAIDGQVV